MKKNRLKIDYSVLKSSINWKKVEGLVPAIVQNSITGQVIMLGYMNKEALRKTISTKKVWFYSRTKKRLWMKGEISKNILNIKDLVLDCDKDTLLIKVEPVGFSCHTGEKTCFGTANEPGILAKLFSLIESRKQAMPKGSYTASLFKSGTDKICQKIYEEAAEVVRAAQKETSKRLIEESVDLIYHLFVLLVDENIELSELAAEIQKRMG